MSLSPWGGGSISPSAAHAPARPLHCICAQASEAKGRATWSPAGRAGQRPCSVLGWSPFLQRGPRGLDHVERGLVAWSLADLGLGSLAANLGPGLSGSGLHSGSFLLCVRPLDAPSASLSLRFLTCEVQRLPTLCTAPPPGSSPFAALSQIICSSVPSFRQPSTSTLPSHRTGAHRSCSGPLSL